MSKQKKLYRNTDDQVISGVISGLSDYTETDVKTLRLIAVLLAIFTTGFPIIIIYIILAIALPVKPKNDYMRNHSASSEMKDKKAFDIEDEYAFDPDEYKMDDEY